MIDENKQADGTTGKPRKITRRTFLKLAGVVLVSTTVVSVSDGCKARWTRKATPASSAILPTTGKIIEKYPEVPSTPETLPTTRALQFFNEDQAKLMDAIAGRIIPGTPDDPGAREADVFLYVDHKLAYQKNNGFVEPTYFQPPFAKIIKTEEPPSPTPSPTPTPTPFPSPSPTPSPVPSSTPSPTPSPTPPPAPGKEIPVKDTEIDRYGFQGKMAPQDTYQKGLASVDIYSMIKFQKKFVDLSEDQQDQILQDMDNGDAQGFDQPSDRVFFKTLRDDVIEGMFSDPVYGGNKDMVGWTLIGYPGAQRAYTPIDIHTEDNIRPPQSIAQMHMFHPGQNANPDVTVPPSGSEMTPQP